MHMRACDVARLRSQGAESAYESAAEKAARFKDFTAEKAHEAKEYAAEKAHEGKEVRFVY